MVTNRSQKQSRAKGGNKRKIAAYLNDPENMWLNRTVLGVSVCGYEKLRFRLDKEGNVAGGIGEDTSFPLFASGTYNINRMTSISLVGGMKTGGELKIENSEGHTIIEKSSDPCIFTGVTFSARF